MYIIFWIQFSKEMGFKNDFINTSIEFLFNSNIGIFNISKQEYGKSESSKSIIHYCYCFIHTFFNPILVDLNNICYLPVRNIARKILN